MVVLYRNLPHGFFEQQLLGEMPRRCRLWSKIIMHRVLFSVWLSGVRESKAKSSIKSIMWDWIRQIRSARGGGHRWREHGWVYDVRADAEMPSEISSLVQNAATSL